MMTEDDARKKWCPFVRLEGETGAANLLERKDGSLHPLGRCIASECMAWRWLRETIDKTTGERAILGATTLENLAERDTAWGYCGLAGKP